MRVYMGVLAAVLTGVIAQVANSQETSRKEVQPSPPAKTSQSTPPTDNVPKVDRQMTLPPPPMITANPGGGVVTPPTTQQGTVNGTGGGYYIGPGYYPNGGSIDTGRSWDDDRSVQRQRPTETPRLITPSNASNPPGVPRGEIDNAIASNPEYQAADAEVTRTQKEYEQARQRVIVSLKNDSTYRAAVNQAEKARSEVEAAHEAAPGASPQTFAPVAQERLQANEQVRKMEDEAIEKDPEAKSARDRFNEANTKRDEVRSRIAASVKGDPSKAK